ncbi:MAG: flagellar hook-associated protein FlgL [Phenylobacterium sp.]|nr:flagellar hook-associated protein FlgL [Phenylobacterium sp.]
MISRIATFANASALLAASLKVQAKLADQQAQEASSLKSTRFSGLKGDAAKVLDLAGQSARLSAESAAATSAAAVVQMAYSSVSSITDLATTVKSRLSAALSGSTGAGGASTGVTAQDAQSWLQTLQAALNTEVGGQYVFAGQAADRAPVDFTSAGYAPAAAPTVADTGYYRGTASPRVLQTTGGTAIQISVAANAPAFETLARALSVIAANPGDPATLTTAYGQVSSALDQLGATQSTLSGQASALDALSSVNTVKTTTLDNLAQNLTGADLASAAVLVTQYDTQLQALYSTIGKLASDSLLKYL